MVGSMKRFVIFGFITFLLVVIPVTVFFLQQQQQIESEAAPSTVLSFTPPATKTFPLQETIGNEFALDITIDPGTNIVQRVVLEITYDESKLELGTKKLELNSAVLPEQLVGPLYTPGKVYVVLSAAAAPTQQVQTKTSLGKIYFKGKTVTGTTPATIAFGPETSAAVGGAVGEGGVEPYNAEGGTGQVLQSTQPATVLIAAATLTGTPTPTGSLTPTGTVTPTPTGALTATPTPSGTAVANQPPVCTALNVDRTTSGVAPYPITFTANGNDTDGTVTKLTFNYGDGPVEDVTEGGGLGTASVSAQKAHTYNNPGTYTATVILTDNNGGVRDPVEGGGR